MISQNRSKPQRYALTLAACLVLLPSAALAAPAAELWAFWDEADPASEVRVDHGAWQAFLDRYVTPDDTGINRVDYRAVNAEDRAALKAYLASLEALDPRTLAKPEQFAYWVNLYNALTVEVVLAHPRKGSILRMGRGFFSIGPWNDPLLTIAGQPVTLNDVEHRILRPIWRDHRIHYAVNCASIGCPNLAKAVFTADSNERLLSEAERTYLNHPRGVGFDRRGRLRLSKIFEWYGEDFGATEADIIRYVAEHHEGEGVTGYTGKVRYEYDWNLNAAAE